jgi:hypothetical protein
VATVTTNFNFPIPQSTDLVKDGATAIAALGTSVDTQFVDLKGGTTGQVLAKASNTDLDYSWTTPQVGDITAVTAGTGISGGGTGGDVTITNSMATAIDAKGDLVAGTGADAFARLAVGNNGETIIADSTTSTGLKWAKSPNFVGCSLYQTAGATSITNNTYVALAYDAERFDTDGFHSNTTNNSRITIPTGLGGYYSIRTNTRFDLSSVGTRQGAIYVNGSVVADNPEYAPSAASYVEGIATVILYLNAGDYIQHYVRQSTAGSLNIFARNEELPFQIQFLGA